MARLNPGLANPGLANPGLANPGLANPGLGDDLSRLVPPPGPAGCSAGGYRDPIGAVLAMCASGRFLGGWVTDVGACRYEDSNEGDLTGFIGAERISCDGELA